MYVSIDDKTSFLAKISSCPSTPEIIRFIVYLKLELRNYLATGSYNLVYVQSCLSPFHFVINNYRA